MVESAIGQTLRIVSANGQVTHYYFAADGSYQVRYSQNATLSSGRWRRDGRRVCVTPSNGADSCFDDTVARRINDTWPVNADTYTLLQGIVTPSPPPPRRVTNPRWTRRPSAQVMAENYPRRALSSEREGSATLDCRVLTGGYLRCRVLSERPTGWGFGTAALAVSRSLQMAPRLDDGSATEGADVTVEINFELDD